MSQIQTPAKKSPNTRLQRARKLNGWSQEYVAEKVGTTAKNVSRWERGDNKHIPYFREKLIRLFGKDAEDLGFLDETTSSITVQTRQPSTSSDIQSADNGIIQDGEIFHSEVSQESIIDMNPGRRHATKLIAAATGSALLPHINLLDQDALEQLSTLMKKPFNIDARAMNSLDLITKSHWELVYSGVPKRDVTFTVQGHLQSLTHLLHHSSPTSIEEQLYTLASQQAQIMNEIYFDMHEYQKAATYTKFAINAAQKANNPALCAVALARMSFLYTYNRQFKEALAFLQIARRYAEQSTDITICCWVAAIEAEVQANIFAHYNDVQACTASLEALERAEHITAQMGDDIFWTKFSPANLAGYKGVCFKQLHKPVEAQHILLDALNTIVKDVPGGRTTRLADLAAAYAQQEELEEACNRASQALTIINNQTRSLNALQRVRNFRSGLERWNSTSYVKDLDEQIAMTYIHIM